MGLGAGILEILFKMVIMVACVVGGTFLGMSLRKRKDTKVTQQEK